MGKKVKCKCPASGSPSLPIQKYDEGLILEQHGGEGAGRHRHGFERIPKPFAASQAMTWTIPSPLRLTPSSPKPMTY